MKALGDDWYQAVRCSAERQVTVFHCPLQISSREGMHALGDAEPIAGEGARGTTVVGEAPPVARVTLPEAAGAELGMGVGC